MNNQYFFDLIEAKWSLITALRNALLKQTVPHSGRDRLLYYFLSGGTVNLGTKLKNQSLKNKKSVQTFGTY